MNTHRQLVFQYMQPSEGMLMRWVMVILEVGSLKSERSTALCDSSVPEIHEATDSISYLQQNFEKDRDAEHI